MDSLQQEVEVARLAMAAKLDDLKRSLQTAASPVEWAQQHPWIVVGMAAATGFAAVSAVTGGARAPAAAGYPPTETPTAAYSNAAAAVGAAPARGPSWTAMLFDLVKVLLTSQMVPMIRAWQQAAADNSAASAQTSAASPAAPNGRDASAERAAV